MVAKTVCNETDDEIEVIVYFGGRSNGCINTSGSSHISLAPGQARDVELGDLRNSYINGIAYCSHTDGARLQTKIFVDTPDSDFDCFLNSENHLSITGTGLAGYRNRRKLKGVVSP